MKSELHADPVGRRRGQLDQGALVALLAAAEEDELRVEGEQLAVARMRSSPFWVTIRALMPKSGTRGAAAARRRCSAALQRFFPSRFSARVLRA